VKVRRKNHETMNNTTTNLLVRPRPWPATRCGRVFCANALARTLASASALPILLALAFTSLPASHARTQANAASPSQVHARPGGKLVALMANAAGGRLATSIEGSGPISAGGMNWAAQTFPSGANPGSHVTHLARGAAGELWAKI
jgi:hypothetical protein